MQSSITQTIEVKSAWLCFTHSVLEEQQMCWASSGFHSYSFPVAPIAWSSTSFTSPSSTAGERPTSSPAPSPVEEVRRSYASLFLSLTLRGRNYLLPMQLDGWDCKSDISVIHRDKLSFSLIRLWPNQSVGSVGKRQSFFQGLVFWWIKLLVSKEMPMWKHHNQYSYVWSAARNVCLVQNVLVQIP